MKLFLLLSSLSLIAIYGVNTFQSQDPESPAIISQPIIIEDDDWRFEGTENMLLVAENRNEVTSRKIALHFFKFPAVEKSSLPPVVFLGAGPGEPYSAKVFFDGRRAEAWRYELEKVNQHRDVILINQRGNSNAPGLQIHNFKYKWNNGGSHGQAFDQELMNENRKEAYAEKITEFENQGVDLRGYDVLHFVDDIEEVRKYYNYEKLALIGNSFASQWALGYIQGYPNNVDRALLSGIEPLDHNYDDPDGIWKVYERINRYALNDPTINAELPKGGLLKAFKTIIKRLESEPVSVPLKDEDGNDINVVVGADDLRLQMIYPYSKSYAMDIATWPKYITEMYYGDFRVLASASIGRMYNSSSLMINPLFNNSLGISKEREKEISNHDSRVWLGEINDHYVATRSICPSPKVHDDFRQHVKHDIPMILIQGDMDLSTPYENAVFLMDYLQNGHLITVNRGSHNAKRAMIFADSILTSKVYQFMDHDFELEPFSEFAKSLPTHFDLPEYTFWKIRGDALFDIMNKD